MLCGPPRAAAVPMHTHPLTTAARIVALAALAGLCSPAPSRAAQEGTAPDGARWTPLPLPELCRPRDVGPAVPLLASAEHLQLGGPDAAPPRREAPLPVALLVQMLEDEVRREGLDAEV
jgi:hypothetical protein